MVESLITAQWTTDENGYLRGVRYHDGALEALSYDGNRLAIDIVHVGGVGRTRLEFAGKVQFGAIGFVSSGIVADVLIWQDLSAAAAWRPEVLSALRVLYGGMYRDPDLSGVFLRQCRMPGVLAFVDFSYGGPISVFSDSIMISSAEVQSE